MAGSSLGLWGFRSPPRAQGWVKSQQKVSSSPGEQRGSHRIPLFGHLHVYPPRIQLEITGYIKNPILEGWCPGASLNIGMDVTCLEEPLSQDQLAELPPKSLLQGGVCSEFSPHTWVVTWASAPGDAVFTSSATNLQGSPQRKTCSHLGCWRDR